MAWGQAPWETVGSHYLQNPAGSTLGLQRGSGRVRGTPGTHPVRPALVTAWQPGQDFSEIFIYFHLQLPWVFVAACRLSSG